MGNLLSSCLASSSRRESSVHSLKQPINVSPIRKSPVRVDSLVDDVSNLQLDREVKPISPVKVQDISSRINETCKRAWAIGESTEEFVRAFDIGITRKDLKTLSRERWLNDEIINFYLALIACRSEQNQQLPKVYSFNTFFLKALRAGGHARVKRWTKNVDIFSYEILLVPVHLGNHWCLAVIDMLNGEINYYDSLGGTNDECLDILGVYLEEEHQDKKKTGFDISSWKFECPRDIPHQNNGSDCGVFACRFAELASRQEKLTFDPRTMSAYRQRMVYEIINKELL